MAIAHFQAEIIKANRNVVWLAAQRHRVRMYDELNGRLTDRVDGDEPSYEEIALPANAPQWIADLVASRSASKASEAIWNKITMEERANGQLAREITVALPIELTCEQNIALAREFVSENVVTMGVIADWVFHNWEHNPHVRLLHTLRPVVEQGFGPKSIPVYDEGGELIRYGERGRIVYRSCIGGKEEFLALRKAWFDAVNRHLELAGSDARIDGRSCEEQGIDNEPGRHIGRARLAIARRRDEGISGKS